ncbi:MAG: DUF2157 domain-containing protein [Bdellovibrionales bacterium]|nr:DUF2157 domain-containing protein [Bdellovibrionales bacterium]
MLPIRKKLDQWVEAGLLQADQAHAIAEHEKADPRNNWTILGIAGLGVIAFVSGMFSLIAGNWETISVTSKIAAYFMIQLGFGALFLSARDHHGVAREISLSFFNFFFLCGIFLIRQIYGLTWEPWQVFLFWILLIFPPTLLARNRHSYHLWVGGFFATLVSYLFYVRADSPQWLPATFMASVGILYMSFAVGIWRFNMFRLPDGLRHAWVSWSVGLLVFGITPIANALWYQESVRGVLEKLPSFAFYTIVPILSCAIAVASLVLSRPRYHVWFRNSTIALLTLVCFFLCTPLLFSVGEQKALGCLGFILVWMAAAAAAGFHRWKRLFDLATLVIAIRFIMVYLESFHADANTGVGLMLSGTLIFCVAFVWHRYRGKVEAWLAARS